jgi:hypothetical protein
MAFSFRWFFDNEFALADIDSWVNHKPIDSNPLHFIWVYSVYLMPNPTIDLEYDEWVKTLDVDEANALIQRIKMARNSSGAKRSSSSS